MDQIIRNVEDLGSVSENTVIMKDGDSLSMTNSEIRFNGTGNILYLDKSVKLENSRIIFNADNSVVFLSENKHVYRVDITVNNNCSCWLGKDGYYNGAVHIICSEEKSVLIGDGVLMSFGVWIRTADPHLVYSISTKERINPSRSVFIGDHVWIGQNALILKGSRIHSGSILGGGAVLAGGRIPSNTSYAGNPAKEIAEKIFWDEPCVHKWRAGTTKKHKTYKGDADLVFRSDGDSLSFKTMESELRNRKTAEEKLEYLTGLSGNDNSSRFAWERKGDGSPKRMLKQSMKKTLLKILK